jgi:hypothetical protein
MTIEWFEFMKYASFAPKKSPQSQDFASKLPISINVQDGINMQEGIFPQNQ